MDLLKANEVDNVQDILNDDFLVVVEAFCFDSQAIAVG